MIVRSRQEVIGLGHPVSTVDNQLSTRTSIIVTSVKLEQTSIVGMTILIVIQDAIHIHNPIADEFTCQYIRNVVLNRIVMCVTALQHIECCLCTVAESIMVH